MNDRWRTFLLFCVAGTIGFAVDAAIVQGLVVALDWNPYLARLISFLAAATVTWLFNRTFTFRSERRDSVRGEWIRYLVAMAAGFVVNFGLYSLLVFHYEMVRAIPALGVAAGSIAGLFVNYLSSRYWVFRRA